MSRRGSSEQGPPRKRRRVIIYSDSDDSDQSDYEQRRNNEGNADGDSQQTPPPENNNYDNSADAENQAPDSVPQQNESSVEEPLAQLDAELLAALGDPMDDAPTYGEKIQQDLAQRWLSVLCKGIPKEKKETLLKEYTLPENCKLLRAPTLNAEISAAISDIARARDKKLEGNQNQLGLGISAVGKGLSLLLTNDDKLKKVQAIKAIADGCRILTDLHYNETQARVKIITPGLDKTFLHVIQDMKRDETLFGEKLSDKIKASKTIERQGFQIKKAVPPKNISSGTSQPQPSTSRSRSQGNWTSASRYQSPNRGGRGGAAYRYGTASRKPASATPTTTKSASTTGNKPRAPTRQ